MLLKGDVDNVQTNTLRHPELVKRVKDPYKFGLKETGSRITALRCPG